MRDPLHSRRGSTWPAVQANYRALAAYLARDAELNRPPARRTPPRAARHPPGRQGQRLRPRRGAGGPGAARRRGGLARRRRPRGGARTARGRGSRPDPGLRRAQRERRRGRLHARPHPDGVEPGRRADAGGGGARPRRPTGLPPQDRHRPQPPRFPPRQPGPDAAPGPWRLRAGGRGPVHALRHRRRPGTRALRDPAGPLRRGPRDRRAARRAAAPRRTPPTAPPACATRARGATWCGRGCSSTAWCRRRWPRRCRSSRR